jgi:hypothetical protein
MTGDGRRRVGLPTSPQSPLLTSSTASADRWRAAPPPELHCRLRPRPPPPHSLGLPSVSLSDLPARPPLHLSRLPLWSGSPRPPSLRLLPLPSAGTAAPPPSSLHLPGSTHLLTAGGRTCGLRLMAVGGVAEVGEATMPFVGRGRPGLWVSAGLCRASPAQNTTAGPCLGCRHSPSAIPARHGGTKGRARHDTIKIGPPRARARAGPGGPFGHLYVSLRWLRERFAKCPPDADKGSVTHYC